MPVANYVVVKDREFLGGTEHLTFTLPSNFLRTGHAILTWHLLEIYGSSPTGYSVTLNGREILRQVLEPRIWNATVTETFGAGFLVSGTNAIDFALSPLSGNFRISDVVLWFQSNSFN